MNNDNMIIILMTICSNENNNINVCNNMKII